MRKTSTAQAETVGKKNRTGLLHNKQLEKHYKASFLCRDGICERDVEPFALPAKKKKKALPQKKNDGEIHKSDPTKENNSLQSADVLSSRCKLAFSSSFFFFFFPHTGSSISLVKNNTSLVIQRNICRKSGQYSYLYMASLHGGVILCTFWSPSY